MGDAKLGGGSWGWLEVEEDGWKWKLGGGGRWLEWKLEVEGGGRWLEKGQWR